MKYSVIYISKVAVGIGISQKVEGGTYSIRVIETIFPLDEEINLWSNKHVRIWEKANNAFMEELCELMNTNLKNHPII